MNYEKDNWLWESHVVTLKNYVKKTARFVSLLNPENSDSAADFHWNSPG